MFTETQEYDITVRATGRIEVQRSDIVSRDGTEIARVYHRHVVIPGDATDTEIKSVQDIAMAVWTPEMIAAAQTAKSAGQL